MKTSRLFKTVLIGTTLLTAISAAFALGLKADAPAAMAFATMHIGQAMLHASQFMHEQAEAAFMALAAFAVMAVIVKRRGKDHGA